VRTKRPPEQRVELTVLVTSSELAALSFVAVIVTSAVEVRVLSAAESALRRIRAAAASHPDLTQQR
jgi:hypothetical protein